MEIKRIDSSQRFSRAVVHGNTAYLSGVIASDPVPSAGEQTRQILAKIDGILAQCGTDKSKLLSATLMLTDLSLIGEVNAVWDQWVAPGSAPARTPIVSPINGPGLLVEIIATAAL